VNGSLPDGCTSAKGVRSPNKCRQPSVALALNGPATEVVAWSPSVVVVTV
jgi:hypothetical protein